MRVQLRDRNPSRGMTWKYGRGRGRYLHSSLPHHYLDSVGIVSQETSLEKDGKVELQNQIQEADGSDPKSTTPAAVTYPSLLDRPTDGTGAAEISAASSNRFGGMVPSSPNGQMDSLVRAQTPEPTSIEYPRSGQGSPQSSYTREAPSQYEGQAWNQGTDSPLTPAPSSYASSIAATPSIPYPLPNMGFYQPQSWVPPFAQYPMPYIAGYPGYVLPSQPVSQSFTSSSGSESSGQSAGAPVPWVSNGGVYPVCIRSCLYLVFG
jgi:hypothetical protein